MENISQHVKNYYMHSLLANISMFVKDYDICQRTRIKSLKHRPYHSRIPLDYSPMKDLLSAMKLMPKGFNDFKYPLVTTCEIVNFVLATPINSEQYNHCSNLILRVICIFGPPKHLTLDKDYLVHSTSH